MSKNKKNLLIALLVVCLVATVALSACVIMPSLTVKFDKSHVVYEGDSLDSLRPYVTVKYTDSTGRVSVVEDYMLSGTVTAGVKNIYVQYEGLTKSFAVVVQPAVDDGGGNDDNGGGNGGGNDDNTTIEIFASSYSIAVGASAWLSAKTEPTAYSDRVVFEVVQGEAYGEIDGNVFNAAAVGRCVIVGKVDGAVSAQITINVVSSSSQQVTLSLSISKTFIEKNDNASLSYSVNPSSYYENVQYAFFSGQEHITQIGRSLRGESSGIVFVQAYVGDYVSNIVSLQIVDPANDPYKYVSTTTFYNNYNPATSLEDAYWRSEHNLMSGSIAEQDQAPTVASNQPKSGNKLVRNSATYYADNGNTWEVADVRGKTVNKIYKFGAYVTLEEVAAYVYAFGNVPANYVSSNDTDELYGNAWGKYLRLNNTYFSGDTGRYPYEPLLPRISGEGGDLDYYEIDVGTTGTDCDPRYDSVIYNDGIRIVRGAARIVYTRYYEAGGHIDDLEDRYVFYTYNHYNDFQEYLNYQGGWGQIFGNITGGGTISSKSNYNPTPYVEVVRQNFKLLGLGA